MNLFHKGLLAFGIVILIAVATVAVLAGHRAESAFRRYAVLYSGRTQMVAALLEDYYAQQGSWSGVESVLPALSMPGHGRGRGGPGGMAGWDEGYIIADAERRIVASTVGRTEGRLSVAEAAAALPLTLNDQLVGYLAPEGDAATFASLDAPATAFVTRLRWALVMGAGIAFLAALLMAGLLTRSIVAPVRQLTQQAEIIAGGDFDVRANVRGHDEISHLADTFNDMAFSLQRAEEARRAQTTDIAHELRNPLAVLQSTLEAFADDVVEPTPENIEPALDQVKTLNRLVDDLRILALADAGRLQLDLQTIDLGLLVRRVAEGYRETLQERSINLMVYIADRLPQVKADYARITQVLNNILANAARYVTAGAEVRVRVDASEEGVLVQISDTGAGVSEAALPLLFDRFWRGEPSRSRETGGSGLGLAIAQQIVKAHQGRIRADPTPGGGLTLSFWLPAV